MEMTYEKTVELERNIKIKNKAKEIVEGFKENVKLGLKSKEGSKFKIWSDQHNACYVEITDEDIIFICDFLHENYTVYINEGDIFSKISSGYRGVNHVASYAKVKYNEYDYRN